MTPVNGYILVRPIREKETPGGIALPNEVKIELYKSKVCKSSDWTDANGNMHYAPYYEGDIIYHHYRGIEIPNSTDPHNDENLFLVEQSCVVAKA